MKKTFLFLCIALLSLGAAAQEKQQTAPKKEVKKVIIDTDKVQKEYRVNGELGHNMRFMGIPNLTEEQQTKLKDLQSAYSKETRKTNNLLNEKKAHLKTLQDEDNIDQNAVNKTIDEMMDLQGKLMKARVNHRIKVRAMLTDEQREAYDRNGSRMMLDGSRNLRINRASGGESAMSIESINTEADNNTFVWSVE